MELKYQNMEVFENDPESNLIGNIAENYDYNYDDEINYEDEIVRMSLYMPTKGEPKDLFKLYLIFNFFIFRYKREKVNCYSKFMSMVYFFFCSGFWRI
jgi:hypothetical protein